MHIYLLTFVDRGHLSGGRNIQSVRLFPIRPQGRRIRGRGGVSMWILWVCLAGAVRPDLSVLGKRSCIRKATRAPKFLQSGYDWSRRSDGRGNSHARLANTRRGHLEWLTKPINASGADDGAGKGEQRQMGIETPLEADTELAKTRQPGMSTLDHPAIPTQTFGALNPAPGNTRHDAPFAQMLAAALEVIPLVGMEFVRASPWKVLLAALNTSAKTFFMSMAIAVRGVCA